jgi:hypothetical protein
MESYATKDEEFDVGASQDEDANECQTDFAPWMTETFAKLAESCDVNDNDGPTSLMLQTYQKKSPFARKTDVEIEVDSVLSTF